MATSVSKARSGWASIAFPPSSENSQLQLTYAGKQDEAAILEIPPASPIELWRGTDAINRLYYGDNLPVLAHLLTDSDVRGKVRLIYIDPPFATNGVFQSRSEQDAYSDLLTGTAYIEFLRQRLILLRELLADDGAIYVHLDDTMVFHVKVILDEIFGADQFPQYDHPPQK